MIKKLLTTLFFIGSYFLCVSQTEITGLVFDEYLEPFPGAIVKTSEGKSTTSDFDGAFKIKVKKFPVTISVLSVGFQTEIIKLKDASEEINVILKETFVLDQVVISASRTPERVMESPVTIERIDAKSIKRTPSPNFYESLGNLKGIDVLADSYGVKTVVSNRGFGNSLNVRFIQLIDGAESTVPILDYSFGNTFGLNELDVKNVEILPGAASALYGANAFNGILLMTSKNPFDYSGVSTYFKSGVTSQDTRGRSVFYDVGIRLAHKFSDVFAAKVNFKYNKGEEWAANDTRNSTGQGGDIISGVGNRNDIDYDGVNSYGDEVKIDLDRLAAFSGITDPNVLNALRDIKVARSGYLESELLEGNTDAKSLLLDAALHVRPWKNDTEIILSSKFNLLDNLLHASNRYVQKGSFIQQHKLELRGKNYFVRGYLSRNDAGETWDSRLAAISINNKWKDNGTYFRRDFAPTFLRLINPSNPNALPLEQALQAAKGVAEQGRFIPGSPEFRNALRAAKSTSVSEGGAKLVDNSGFLNVDANYNFAEHVDFADIQVGGSYRKYILDSDGQVYTDDDGSIEYRLFGFYTQIQKKILDDRLKMTGTIRFDKSDNFDANFSPRLSISYAAGNKRDHNFRLAFQTGFRNPTTQDQYIGLQLGQDRIFLGTVEENLSREQTEVTSRDGLVTATLSGVDAFNNSYITTSVETFFDSGDINDLEKAEIDFLKPEIVRSFELGYRGATSLADNLLEFDIVGFYNFHEDFITTKDVFVPFYGTAGSSDVSARSAIRALQNQDFLRYVLRTNTKSKIDTYGFSAGFNTKLFKGFDIGLSYAFADFKSDGKDPQFKEAFNTPKHKVKVQFGHDKLFKNFGFNINARWQDEFLYESFFVDGIVEARTVLDAQINYSIPSMKSFIKIGGTNLGRRDYISVPGTGSVGSQYYVSWVINN